MAKNKKEKRKSISDLIAEAKSLLNLKDPEEEKVEGILKEIREGKRKPFIPNQSKGEEGESIHESI